jgi:hypothetical protein
MSLTAGIAPEALQVPSTWFSRSEDDGDGRRGPLYSKRTTANAYVASVSARERLMLGQFMHPVTHNVVYTEDLPAAKEGDYFLIDGRRFYVRGVENPGEVDLVLLFRTEERPDRDE